MIFVAAGIDSDQYNHVQGLFPAAFGAGNYVISSPFRKRIENRAASARAHADELLLKTARYLSENRDATRSGLAALFVTEHVDEFDAFSEIFFPFSVVVPASIPPRAGTATARKHLIADALRRAAPRARDIVRAMQIETTEWQTRTPLILPIRNFRSDYLRPEMEALFRTLSTSDNPQQLITDARNRLTAHHPRQGQRKQLRFFADAGGTRFSMPGRHRHGRAHLSADHPASCFVNGMLRLGGRLEEGFHYDCAMEGRRMRGLRPNCHDAENDYEGGHLNIAPNDYIRL